MGPDDINLPKPYATTEIEKRPYPVLISLLIGLLIASITWNITNDSSNKREMTRLRDKVDSLNLVRIQMLETVVFYRDRWQNSQATSDSVLRDRTAPYVNQILIKTR